MKVIENYKRAIENSDEYLLKEVFAPQVRVEVPAGPSVDYPVNNRSLYLESSGQNCSWNKVHLDG